MIDDFVLIIGAMRCGTTSLFHYLSEHPQVASCRDKEPDFFAVDSRWSRGLEWYLDLWSRSWNPGVSRIALEASTNYSKRSLFPLTVARIATIKARFRFIYLLRDPIHRIESHYTLGAAKGWREALRPLADGIHPDLIEPSRYAAQLDPYRERFSRESILLLAFEALQQRPEQVISSVCRFLDIDPSHQFRGLDLIHNSNVGRRPGEIGQRLYRLRTFIPYWQRIVRSIPPERRNAIRRLMSRRGGKNAQLSEEQQRFLLRELSDDLRRLRGEYGFDTSIWGLEDRGD